MHWCIELPEDKIDGLEYFWKAESSLEPHFSGALGAA